MVPGRGRLDYACPFPLLESGAAVPEIGSRTGFPEDYACPFCPSRGTPKTGQRADRESTVKTSKRDRRYDRSDPYDLTMSPCQKVRTIGFFRPIPPTWWLDLKRR